jgi:hypothetical protein
VWRTEPIFASFSAVDNNAHAVVCFPIVLQGQVDYVRQLASYGKPVVLVLVQGRPRLLQGLVSSVDAVLNAYVPGECLRCT